jgi:hypothetical protein
VILVSVPGRFCAGQRKVIGAKTQTSKEPLLSAGFKHL